VCRCSQRAETTEEEIIDHDSKDVVIGYAKPNRWETRDFTGTKRMFFGPLIRPKSVQFNCSKTRDFTGTKPPFFGPLILTLFRPSTSPKSAHLNRSETRDFTGTKWGVFGVLFRQVCRGRRACLCTHLLGGASQPMLRHDVDD
jgi:hypothetical protein